MNSITPFDLRHAVAAYRCPTLRIDAFALDMPFTNPKLET